MSTDPFEWGPAHPAPPARTGLKRPPKPFQLQLEELAEFGDPERGGGRVLPEAKRRKQPDHSGRCIEAWGSLGYFAFRVDGWMMKAQSVVKKDLLGCWDVMAVKPGAVALVQITSRDNYSAHLRKIVSDEPAPDNRAPRVQNTLRLLDAGVELYMHLFWQPGGPGSQWVNEMRPLTREVIEGAIGRKRK